jgi:hypothetical protein
MRACRRALGTVALLLWLAGAAGAQQQPPPPPPSQEGNPAPAGEAGPAQAAPPPANPSEPGGSPATAETGPGDKPLESLLPRLDVFFPEGDLDLRVSRLLNKVFFEGQVKYNFVNGDISAFLRYRYYSYHRITQLAVFDSIEFAKLQAFSSDFDRVRGTLLLLQWPYSYSRRAFALTEIDRISSNKEGAAQSLRLGRTNTFVRFGYQLGTPGDARSNAIVGETRARSEQLFTAYREIGPGDAGFTGAVTYGFKYLSGDFDYLKLEAEGLKRFDISARTFLVARVHAGSIPHYGRRRGDDLPPPPVAQTDLYTIPGSEFFRLDGRDSLRGLKERTFGTDELHTTWEYFFPWFLDTDHDFLRLKWQNWYWILYAGAGAAGFDRAVYTEVGQYIPDAGLGFESSFKLQKYKFFLSGIVAQALKGKGGVEARISVKSYR